MAFVEYNDGEFVRLEEISLLKIKDGQIEFIVKGDNVSIFSVHEEQLQDFIYRTNSNFRCWKIEEAYKKEFGVTFDTLD